MSAKYRTVLGWWNRFHSEIMVNNAVKKGWITEEEAQEIMNS